jgi:hypothetical protein
VPIIFTPTTVNKISEKNEKNENSWVPIVFAAKDKKVCEPVWDLPAKKHNRYGPILI